MKIRSIYFLLALLVWSCTPPQPAAEFEKVEDLDALPEGLYTPDWIQNATIYEVNIRQHTPEGTFQALKKDLTRISDMGISIIWLMPIHPIGEVNRKGSKGSYYSVKDYKDVNPEFGTKEDFAELVREAHRLDMNVIIDWVANHTAFDHVWTETNKEWYRLDEAGNLQPPVGTDWTDVAHLDFEKPELRAAMIDAMSYWVREFDIDGFRCDVASAVPTDFWNVCVDSLRTINREIFMLAEAEEPELHEKAFNAGYAWDWLHLINGVAKGEKSLDDIDAYMAAPSKVFPEAAFKMYFTTNHDENSWNGTVIERFGDPGHLSYAALTFTIGGMPLVYGGQEAGLNKALAFFEKDQVEWGDYKHQDFYSKLLILNRNNRALWNGAEGGDFKRLKTNADDAVYAFVRTRDDHQVITICNLKKNPVKIQIEDLPEGVFQSLFDDIMMDDVRANGLELTPFGYQVFYK